MLCLPAFAISNTNKLGPISSLNLGVQYTSKIVNRGVIQYNDFQIFPVVGVFLFTDKLEYLGDSIGYRDFVYSDILRLRTRLQTISDNPLFPDNKSIRDNYPDRRDSYEWQNSAEFFIPGYNDQYSAEIDFIYAKDIQASLGHYFDVRAKLKLFDIKPSALNVKIEPNLFASVGYGDAKHNSYFYGPEADKAGLNNLSYGLWFAFPEEADRNYPIILIEHFEVLGERNKNALFAKDRNSGFLFSFIATVGLLE
jgi:hypothetical protein